MWLVYRRHAGFGNYVWPVSGGGVFLHSGRALPGEGEPRRRYEGMGILLNAKATELWRRSGEEWKVISLRIVTARILVGAKGYKIRQGSNLKLLRDSRQHLRSNKPGHTTSQGSFLQ